MPNTRVWDGFRKPGAQPDDRVAPFDAARARADVQTVRALAAIRRAKWYWWCAAPPDAGAEARRAKTLGMPDASIGWFAVITGLIAFGVLTMLTPMPAWVDAFLVVIIVSVLGGLASRGRAPSAGAQWLQRAVQHHLCPSCNYDLGGAGDELHVCPECGLPWPLVPPEV